MTYWVKGVYNIELAGTQCGEPCGRRWRWFFSVVSYITRIMFYICCYPNETTMVMIELRRRRHERGLTIPNAISFTDSYINEGLATCTNFSPANFLLFNAICQFIIPGKRICYLVQFVLMKTHKCALQLYRRHRWFRLTKKLSMVYQSRTVQHHRCLEWYWYVALSCIEFDGWFQGAF